MEKKENTGTKLNVLLCNLVDYVRGDDRPLVFAVMQEITEYFEQELDRARKEGVFTEEELRYLLEIIQLDYSLATMYQQREKSDIGGKLLRKLSKLTTK